MNNSFYFSRPHDRACFSAASSPSLAAKSSYCLSHHLNGTFLSLTFNQSSFKLVLNGDEGRVCRPIVFGLAKTGYGSQYKYTKRARRKLAQKRYETQKEAEREARLSKRDSTQPSEDCLFRFFEEQPLRLQNSNPTFQCISSDTDIIMQKTPRILRKVYSASTNISTEGSYTDGGFHEKPDFTTRLLEYLSGAKEEVEFNEIKLTGHIDSQLLEKEFEYIGMQIHPQSQVFTGSVQGSRLALDVEKEANLFGVTNKFPDDDILDDPLRQGDHSAAEETGFSSDFSDDDNYDEPENPQGLPDLKGVTSECLNDHFENNKAIQSESFPSPTYNKEQTCISPRHLSRSSGSRSCPSRSSIPGLRSKYSKPDPKAKPLVKHGRPLCLLPNFTVINEQTSIYPLDGDDVMSSTLSHGREREEKEFEEDTDFDWWESDQDEKDNNKFPAGVKSVTRHEARHEAEMPSNLQLDSAVATKSNNTSHSTPIGTSRCFQYSNNQIVKNPGECIDLEWFRSDGEKELRVEDSPLFDWSDSDEERDLGAENSQVFEWTDSDDDTGQREEVSQFEWSDSDVETDLKKKRSNLRRRQSDARDRNGRGNGILYPNTEHSLSGQRKQRSTLSKEKSGSKSTSLPHIWYNRKECQQFRSFTSNSGNPFPEKIQVLAHNESQKLPSSVKFLEAPSWKRQTFPHVSFYFEYSYTEIPKAPVLGFRDHFSPFCPETMQRPWTGRPHVKPRRPLEAVLSFDPELERVKSFELSFNRKWKPPKRVKSREEVLGQPLTDDEVTSLVQNCHAEKRQVNLGRDGLTHNMLHLIHAHWKNRPVCRVKCRGPPTLNMDNLCFHIEDKTGGQIIYRTGCVLYLFRGRHYNYRYRPLLPYMLYRPSSPVYPKLVPQAPAGLTIEEAKQLRSLGQRVKPLIKLGKNGAFPNLVRLVQDAFSIDDLVSIDYEGLKPSDYRKIGAKLKELVPCVLLSLRNNRLVLWRGKNWSPSSSHSFKLHVETGGLATEPTAKVGDIEGSSVTAAEFRSMDVDDEAVAGKVGDSGIQTEDDTEHTVEIVDVEESSQIPFEFRSMPIGNEGDSDVRIQIEEETSDLLQEAEGGNMQLHHPGNLDHMCRESLIQSSVIGQDMQAGAEACSAVTDVVVQDEVIEASAMCGNVDAVWDTALKEGVAVELEGGELDPDYVLQLAAVFAEVAPIEPTYSNQLLNRLRLQGVYKKRPNPFVVRFRVRRETVPRRKRLQKETSPLPKVKRHPDMGLPLDALSRILDQK